MPPEIRARDVVALSGYVFACDDLGLASRGRRLEHTFIGIECCVGGQHVGLAFCRQMASPNLIVRFTADQEAADRIAPRLHRIRELDARPACSG